VHLTFDDQRIDQRARVVDGDEPEPTAPSPIDVDDGDVAPNGKVGAPVEDLSACSSSSRPSWSRVANAPYAALRRHPDAAGSASSTTSSLA
jgi:hypothetical protein